MERPDNMSLKKFEASLNSLLLLGYNETDPVIQELMKRKKEQIKKAVDEIHKYSITQGSRLKNGKPYEFYSTVVNTKGARIKCHTLDALYEKLYELYFGSLQVTLSDIYDDWLKQFKELISQGHRSVDTLIRYELIWRIYFSESPLIHEDICKIRLSEIKQFYAGITSHQSVTRKELNNVKSLMNHLYDMAIEKDLNVAPFNAVSTKDLICKENFSIEDVYTNEERAKILSECLTEEGNVYAQAIYLQFNLCARVGEIKALKWTDIDFNKQTVSIHAEVIRKPINGTIKDIRVEHTKNRKASGNRTILLNEEVFKWLRGLYKNNPFSEYLFLENGNFLTTCKYNRVLKQICQKAKVRYLSSHKIRFWAVTTMFDNGMNPRDIQRIAGHSNIEMTQHYDRSDRNKAIQMIL